MKYFSWTLLIYQAVVVTLTYPHTSVDGSCNYQRGCGIDITQDQCEQRNCCFQPSINRHHNCFQRINTTKGVSAEQRRTESDGVNHNNPNGEIPPPDAFNLPREMERYINMFTQTGAKQLTPAQAIHIANLFERFLVMQASRGVGVNWKFTRDNVFHVVVKTKQSTLLNEVEFESGTKINLNQTHAELANKNVTAVIIVEYLTMGRILKGITKQNRSTEQIISENGLVCPLEVDIVDNSTVLSVTAYNKEWNKVPVSLHFTLTKINATNNVSSDQNDTGISCQYLDESINHWSPYGCQVVGTGQGKVNCFCNHTTKFSVLFAVRPLPFEMPPHHASNILILEFVMEGLSFTSLTITMFCLFLVLRRRSKSPTSTTARERSIVHINFVASLSALHLFRLISEAALGNNIMCGVTVVLSHYFVLTSGMWMLIEGLVLYLNLVVKSTKFNKLGWYKFAAGWGIPGIIVLISAVIGFRLGIYVQKAESKMQCPQLDNKVSSTHTETEFKYCWLGTKDNMIWSAAGPLIAIFIINLFILAHTVALILKLSLKSKAMKPLSNKSQHGQHLWNTTKGVLVLFPILGVPWLIGFLVNIHDYKVNIVFQYIHVTLNGLQGLFIFILYSVVNKEVREILYRVVSSKWDQHKLSRSTNNSISAKDRWKKSIQSIVNANNSTASLHKQVKNSNLSQQSFNTQQRRSSGSNSAASTMYRVKKKYSSGSYDKTRMSDFGKPGSSCSLPRGMGYQSAPQVTRTPSTRSLHSENNSIPRICNICGSLKKHSKLSRLDSGCSNCKKNLSQQTTSVTDINKEIDTVEIDFPFANQRWHRMTAEEFKRFSAIPEERRRSGVNSFYQENEGASMPWEKKSKTIERTNVSRKIGLPGNSYIVEIDIHKTPENDKDIGVSKPMDSEAKAVEINAGEMQTSYFSMVRNKDVVRGVADDDDDDYAELPV